MELGQCGNDATVQINMSTFQKYSTATISQCNIRRRYRNIPPNLTPDGHPEVIHSPKCRSSGKMPRICTIRVPPGLKCPLKQEGCVLFWIIASCGFLYFRFPSGKYVKMFQSNTLFNQAERFHLNLEFWRTSA